MLLDKTGELYETLPAMAKKIEYGICCDRDFIDFSISDLSVLCKYDEFSEKQVDSLINYLSTYFSFDFADRGAVEFLFKSEINRFLGIVMSFVHCESRLMVRRFSKYYAMAISIDVNVDKMQIVEGLFQEYKDGNEGPFFDFFSNVNSYAKTGFKIRPKCSEQDSSDSDTYLLKFVLRLDRELMLAALKSYT
jgi:hypothetical protein